jgi:hypothetical protein
VTRDESACNHKVLLKAMVIAYKGRLDSQPLQTSCSIGSVLSDSIPRALDHDNDFLVARIKADA